MGKADTTYFRQNAPKIMRRLMAEFGIDVVSAAAILGNLGHESGGFKSLQELRPIVAGSAGGYGYAQWTGSRRTQFMDYANRAHLAPSSFEANVGFLVWELRNTEKRAIPAVKNAVGLRNKVIAFENAFERAHKDYKYYDSRERWATIALAEYKPGDPAEVEKPKAPVDLPVPPAIPTTGKDAKQVGWFASILAAISGGFWAVLQNQAFQLIAVAVVIAAIGWFIVRPIVIRYNVLGELEAGFFTKVRIALKGVKTKLFAAFLSIAGVALPFLSFMTDSNFLEMLPPIMGIPATIYGFGVLAIIGWIMDVLRNNSNTVAGQTDLAIAGQQMPVTVVSEPAPIEVPEIVQRVRRVSQTRKKTAKRRR